jgi:hypothetical protein
MIRSSALALASAPFALAGSLTAALAAQQAPQSFTLPTATPTPSPAPAGPADERAGVAIPPRSVPDAAPSPSPTARPVASPPAEIPVDAVILPPPEFAPPRGGARPAPQAAPSATGAAPDFPPPLTPGEFDDGVSDYPQSIPPGTTQPDAPAPRAPTAGPDEAQPGSIPIMADWWLWAGGALGAAALLLGGGALLRRRRRPKALRLAAPGGAAQSDAATDIADPPRLDLTLDITGATRSVMMFTLQYRLTIANRSERAVCDLALALQIACARASAGAEAGANAPSAGAARQLETIARIGPHQARSIVGTVQLPLSAVAPLRQGNTPLFVPLVHVTLEGESQRALANSFVIGTPSASGRVHPIRLDQPPGTILGLVAQAIAVTGGPAAA